MNTACSETENSDTRAARWAGVPAGGATAPPPVLFLQGPHPELAARASFQEKPELDYFGNRFILAIN